MTLFQITDVVNQQLRISRHKKRFHESKINIRKSKAKRSLRASCPIWASRRSEPHETRFTPRPNNRACSQARQNAASSWLVIVVFLGCYRSDKNIEKCDQNLIIMQKNYRNHVKYFIMLRHVGKHFTICFHFLLAFSIKKIIRNNLSDVILLGLLRFSQTRQL